jgi:hypothetical protein
MAPSQTHGDAAERRARGVAAKLGVADFVYVPPLVHKASGVREVGDGLLICRNRAAVLQVKTRDAEAGSGDDHNKAIRKIRKYARNAVSQGRGSLRTIKDCQREGQPLCATPVRALSYPTECRADFALSLDMDTTNWPLIVVIDHPLDIEVNLETDANVFYITLDDWSELNSHIRSVNGVIRYVERALQAQAVLTVPLGAERRRFAVLAEADAASTAGSRTAVPWLSYAGADDPVAVALYRELLENVWVGELRGRALTPAECRLVLNFLDDVPAEMQSTVGRWVFSKRRELDATGRRASGSLEVRDADGGGLLVYMCDREGNEPDLPSWRSKLASLTLVRLAEWREQLGRAGPGVGIGVRETGGVVEYTHFYASEPMSVPIEVRRRVEWIYGVSDFRIGRTRELAVGRNEPCPCGSRQKFKRCHGSPAG